MCNQGLHIHTIRVKMIVVKHPETRFQQYLKDLGDELASELLDVKPRTVRAWRLGDRLPKPALARKIVQRAPITIADIYGA